MQRPAICILIVAALVSGTQAASPFSPILYYSFDNPADPGHDDTSNGNDLTIPGPWSSVAGSVGNGIHFDHYDGGDGPRGAYVSTAALDYPGPNGFTVEYRIQAGSTPGPGAFGVRDYWEHVAGGEVFGLRYYDSPQKADFFMRHDFGPSTVIEAPVQKDPSEWVTLRGVYQPQPLGYQMSLYVDGFLANQANMPGPMRANIPPYLYASGSWHAAEAGTIDELKIYDTAVIPGDLNGDGFVGQDDLDKALGRWGTWVLPNHVTQDLTVATSTDWLSSQLLVTLTNGEVYQNAAGGTGPPNPAFFDAFAGLEFDTYVDPANIAGGAVDLPPVGPKPLQFDESGISIAWYNTETDDIGAVTVARVTLSDDAEGEWKFLASANGQDWLVIDDGTIGDGLMMPDAAGSGSLGLLVQVDTANLADPSGDGFVSQPDLDEVLANWGAGTPPPPSVPEPVTLSLLGLGSLAAMRRRRRQPITWVSWNRTQRTAGFPRQDM